MKNKLQYIKEYIRVKGERGQSFVLAVIEVALAVYILVVLIRYLIIPAILGH